MRKNFGVKSWFCPLPVLIIAAYDEKNKANAMNAAWGGLYGSDLVELSISKDHKTTKNIMEKKAFTVSFGNLDNLVACDYVGLVSGNDDEDKMAKSGFTTSKSEFVDAPIINELPLTLDCQYVETTKEGNIIGKIVNVSADERILGEDGLVSYDLLQPLSFEPVHNDYVVVGKKVGKAFSDGEKLK